MGNPVVRFEIGAADDQPLVRFYGELFGWDLRAVTEEYTLVDTRGGRGINGGIGRSQTGEPWATFYVEVDDPDGLLVGLMRSGASFPRMTQPPSEGNGAAVDWFEVLGADAGRSQAFYAELFGWEVPGGAYGQVAAGIGGGIGAGGEARWVTVYAAVEDVEATLARAGSLGGTRVYGPNPVDDHTDTGAFRDPAGNLFGVYRHGPH
jgi:predicted enzyme related to lactoylglutathione lyase